jgi:phosphoribosylformimino-5-aminoimidazole carboxamide ribonucleotide (ProFAR) isomerase
LRKHINAGGGILRPRQVNQMFAAGASSVFIGSVAILRPWNVQPAIRTAHRRAKLMEGV